MSRPSANVLGALGRKFTEIEGQLPLFDPEDEPDTATEEPNDSTNDPERTAQ
ncbi:hypothetical protein ACFY2Z_41005 [Streptomyces sp. NPDC001222]|uniref:hypothetical protein n=1 Tax=Streptomyces sp. NPDC001222 TaxID=3364548 RepID=UPI00368581D0